MEKRAVTLQEAGSGSPFKEKGRNDSSGRTLIKNVNGRMGDLLSEKKKKNKYSSSWY